MSGKVPAIVMTLLCSGMLRGDIAPTTYDGYTLTTKANSDIRMQSEEVDIYCGDRCRVVARFDMRNETDKPIRLSVGFPVEEPGWKQKIYDFRVTINEESRLQKVRRVPMKGPYQDDEDVPSSAWFGWDQAFQPGRTTIRVEYHIEPSPSYLFPWLNVYYRLDTGALWKGTIGRADVTVHFEAPLAGEQIREATWPEGFRINGDELYWCFTDIEPQYHDNVQIEYMPFDLYRELERLRNRIKENPQDGSRVVDLAKRYFALGPYKGFAGDYSPSPITSQEYNSIVAKISDPDQRAAFEEYWKNMETRPVFGQKLFASKWTDRLGSLSGQYETTHVSFAERPFYPICHIMSSAGYLPYKPPYVIEAKEMLERLLEKNPANADAWMVYIENCFRFVYGAFDMKMGWCPVAPKQREIVERAYSHCPSHEGIKAWHDYVSRKETYGYPVPEALVNQLKTRLNKIQPRH